ncbi:hypothetical protein HOU08_gp181 [Dickeya phage vB_DsoM_JA29]|uniref:Uncharacterized protein n=1 Tax=Dickeya phage vB_DsoM_JA29 TaxID=2283031 RepID=A0A384ZXF0_9CAUD|nr:hypothetical protein HOU08_gp181 [Dickeya phage vB_DsoM_JA29]AXG66907.1 hypothetical protein JA29_181 [Dickeya phage vB_DsoM_JA29]
MEILVSISAALSNRALQEVLNRGKLDVRVVASRKISNTQYLFAYMNEDGDNVVCRATLAQAGLAANKYVLRKVEPLSTEETLWHVQKAFDKFDGAGTSLSSPPPLYSLIYPLSDLGVDRTPDLDDILRDWEARFSWMFNSRWVSVDWASETIEVCLHDPARQNAQMEGKMKEIVFCCLQNYLRYRGKC